MDYIDNKITIEEFLQGIQIKSMREQYASVIHQFGFFCKDEFNKTCSQVLGDLATDWGKTHSSNKIILVLNKFVKWCLRDHPEIIYYHGKYNHIKRSIGGKNPSTIKLYVNKIRQLLDDVWNVEVNVNKISRKVKIPKPEEEEPEAFTKEQMRIFLDSISNTKKLQFMVLKDTGMRIQELCQIRKKDVEIAGKRIKISIQSRYTKTKRARICYITRETEPSFLRLCKNKEDNALLFGTNEDSEIAKGAFQTSFAYYRDKMAKTHPEFGEKYQSNDRHKKTIHSIRAYTSTQCAIAIDETWGHEYIGHKKYLGQYIRNQDQFVEKFIRSENQLMLYDTIEVVDSDERVKKLEEEQEKSRQDMIALTNVMNQLSSIRADNMKKEQEIKELQKILAR
jgi:integrase